MTAGVIKPFGTAFRRELHPHYPQGVTRAAIRQDAEFLEMSRDEGLDELEIPDWVRFVMAHTRRAKVTNRKA